MDIVQRLFSTFADGWLRIPGEGEQGSGVKANSVPG
jgi:hypothetical protein